MPDLSGGNGNDVPGASAIAPDAGAVVEHKAAFDPARGDAANYVYWQEHGGEWADEYDKRKLLEPRYHIQELMLGEYVELHAARTRERPLHVLEYGCGVGRHLRNLSRIPNTEVFGYDQSPTMVGCMRRWADASWIDDRVRLGPPTGRLPWEDDAFDIVYSCEVMVHVRPEDLAGRIKEMMRVSRGQVLLIEPSPHYHIIPGAHDGCWNHDIPTMCARMGVKCEVMASGFFSQTPMRIVMGEGHPWGDLSALRLSIMRRMESDLLRGLARVEDERDTLRNRARLAEQRADRLVEGGRASAERVARLEKLIDELRGRLAHAQGTLAERAERIAAQDARVDQLRADAHAARELVDQRNTRIGELEARVGELIERAKAAEKRLDATRIDLDAARQRVREMQDRLRQGLVDAGAQLAMARTRAEEAARDARNARSRLDETVKRLEEESQEVERLRTTLVAQINLGAALSAARAHDRARDQRHVALVDARAEAFVRRAREIIADSGQASEGVGHGDR